MESATWLDWDDALHSDLPEGRIYLGGECCERMLPAPAIAWAAIERLRQAGREITLVLPMATESGLAAVADLLAGLAGHGDPLEVACNDWGSLEIVLQSAGCAPVVGRLLSQQCTDPRWSTITDGAYQARFEKDVLHSDGTVARLAYRAPSAAVLKHIRAPGVAGGLLLGFLAELGVRRFEISNLLQGVETSLPAGWHATLHAPTVIVAVRRCALTAALDCGRACRHGGKRIDDPAFPVALYTSPCQVYYLNRELGWVDRQPGIDRIVHSHVVDEAACR